MNKAGFLAEIAAQWPEQDGLPPLARRAHPLDRRLATLLAQIPGLSTENILMLLNAAARWMDRDEVFVEIGSLHGLTIAGAAAGNRNAAIYACDNFRRADARVESLRATLESFTAHGQVAFFRSDLHRFLQSAPWSPRRVGVFFYDGPHSFHHQVRALCEIAPHLSASALVIVDDTNDWPVCAALRWVARRFPQLTLLLSVSTPADHDRRWWNGVRVYHWDGSRTRPAQAVVPPKVLPGSIVWDTGIGFAQRAVTLPLYVSEKVRFLVRSHRRRHGGGARPPASRPRSLPAALRGLDKDLL